MERMVQLVMVILLISWMLDLTSSTTSSSSIIILGTRPSHFSHLSQHFHFVSYYFTQTFKHGLIRSPVSGKALVVRFFRMWLIFASATEKIHAA